MRAILILTIAVFTLSCRKINDTTIYMHQNSFDNYKDYGFDNPTLRSGNAHSGEWYCELDTINQYSIAYEKKVSDLPVKNPKKIKLSAWLYLPAFNAKATVVASLGEPGKPDAIWNGLNSEDLVDEEKKWVQVLGSFELPDNLNPNHVLKVYVWNHGKEPVRCDDVAFDLE